MAFENYTTERLKKMKSNLVITSVIGLFLMCIALGYSLYQLSHQKDSSLIYLVPTVFGPIAFLPIIISTLVDGELKKRADR